MSANPRLATAIVFTISAIVAGSIDAQEIQVSGRCVDLSGAGVRQVMVMVVGFDGQRKPVSLKTRPQLPVYTGDDGVFQLAVTVSANVRYFALEFSHSSTASVPINPLAMLGQNMNVILDPRVPPHPRLALSPQLFKEAAAVAAMRDWETWITRSWISEPTQQLRAMLYDVK
jgi:hypothetical protein